MDELIRESLRNFNSIEQISTLQLFIALTINLILTIILVKFYMITHRGYSYSKSYIQSIVYVGLTITLIMIIIGSNIARAFALVGAMSIVRFRNPVKDSRDLVFIFMAMAIGMACGTQFYLFAIMFTMFVVAIASFFHIVDFGELSHQSYIFKIQMTNRDEGWTTPIFEKYCVKTSIVSIDRHVGNGDLEDIIYEVDLKKKAAYNDLFSALSKSPNVDTITLLVGESSVNV